MQSTDKSSLILSGGPTSDVHLSFEETKVFQTSSNNLKEKRPLESKELFSEKCELEKGKK